MTKQLPKGFDMAANPDEIAPGSTQAISRRYTAGVAAMNIGNPDRPLAQLEGDTAPILERLRLGETAPQIAASLNVHHTALYAWLLRHCPEQWQALSAARQLARLDDCEQSFDDVASDNVTVTRAREKAKLAQWHLERANRKLFGQDRDSQAGVQINVIVQRNQDDSTESVLTITQEK